jgi:hypothetical protein
MLAGCDSGPATVPVSGRARFSDGTPVDTGKVEFRSPDGRFIGQGTLDRQGRFTLRGRGGADGLPAGTYQVIIVQMILADILPTAGHDHGPARVPLEYGDYHTSRLQAVVEATGPNEIDLTVELADEDGRD